MKDWSRHFAQIATGAALIWAIVTLVQFATSPGRAPRVVTCKPAPLRLDRPEPEQPERAQRDPFGEY